MSNGHSQTGLNLLAIPHCTIWHVVEVEQHFLKLVTRSDRTQLEQELLPLSEHAYVLKQKSHQTFQKSKWSTLTRNVSDDKQVPLFLCCTVVQL